MGSSRHICRCAGNSIHFQGPHRNFAPGVCCWGWNSHLVPGLHFQQGFYFQGDWGSYQLPQSPGLLEWRHHPLEPHVTLSWLAGPLSPPTCPLWLWVGNGLGSSGTRRLAWGDRLTSPRRLLAVSGAPFPHHRQMEITATPRSLSPSQPLPGSSWPHFKAWTLDSQSLPVASAWTRCGQARGRVGLRYPAPLHTGPLPGVLVP